MIPDLTPSPSERGQHHWPAIATITCVAMAVRIAWVTWGAWWIPDADEYLTLARWIVSSGTFSYDGLTPTSYRPPLYPALPAT